MNSGIRDKVEGAFHEMKGKVKEAAGKMSGSPKLEAEGSVEKKAGKFQETIGQLKHFLRKER